MDTYAELAEPTSTAATRATEPEVVAGISSGDIGPGVPTEIRTGRGSSLGFTSLALLLAGGLALGYGVSRWWRA